VAKALYLSSQNIVDCYKSFCSVSKFFITNTIFFPSWNICSIIPLISITYLALVHNYNTIKCICFISPRQRAGIWSRVCVCVREREVSHKCYPQGVRQEICRKGVVLGLETLSASMDKFHLATWNKKVFFLHLMSFIMTGISWSTCSAKF